MSTHRVPCLLIGIIFAVTTNATGMDIKCPSSFKAFQHNCYKFVAKTVTQYDAEAACVAENAQLASIHNDAEQIYVSESSKRDQYWIGLVDKGKNGTWSWTDGSPFDYRKFDKNYGGKNFCAYLLVNGEWNDYPCNVTTYGYVCKWQPLQKNKGNKTNTDRQTIHSDPRCPNQWTAIGGNCYKLTTSADESFTQKEAEDACIDENAHLLSVHSLAEQILISDYFGKSKPFWIGLVDNGKNRMWSWTDGTPFDYDNWKNNEPDNVNSNEFCVQTFMNEHWVAFGAVKARGYMCKKSISTISNGSEEGCPKFWHNFELSCYKFDRNILLQDEAEAACVIERAHLVSIHSENELSFVSHLSGREWYFWIGLIDPHQNGTWQWTDGTPVDYLEWADGEPKALNVTGVVTETFNFWSDVPCDGSLDSYMCKQPMRKETGKGTDKINAKNDSIESGCPSFWKAFEYHCYKFDANAITQEQAETACVSENAHLASIHSEAERIFVTDKTGASFDGRYIWIGLQNKGKWMWTDGSPFDFQKWDAWSGPAGQPDNAHGNDYCVLHRAGYGYWDDQPCNYQMGYICKQPMKDMGAADTRASSYVKSQPGCPPYWKAFNNFCYKYDANSIAQEQAEAECSFDGGHLASVHSNAEGRFIIDLFGRKGSVWFGLFDKDKNRKWSWTDGSPYDYVDWSDGEPDNGLDGIREYCAFVYFDGTWNDFPCNETRGYVCKRPMMQKMTGMATEQPSRCPNFWMAFDGYCYKLDANSVTHSQAEVACVKAKAHLLSLHSEAERNFINDKYGSNLMNKGSSVWIGLVDKEKDRNWTWTDNTPYDYKRWDRDEPSDAEGEEYCVASRANGAWSDESCVSKRGYICKQQQPSKTQATVATAGHKSNNTRNNNSTAAIPRCPPFWTAFEKRCQKVNTNGGLKNPGYSVWIQHNAILIIGLFVTTDHFFRFV